MIQIIAMIYGVYSIAQARPVWIAFNYDRFELVRNNEIKVEHIKQALPQYQHATWLQVEYVGVKQATNLQEQQIEQMGAMLNGISLAQYPERYIPLEKVTEQVKLKAHAFLSLIDGIQILSYNRKLKHIQRQRHGYL